MMPCCSKKYAISEVTTIDPEEVTTIDPEVAKSLDLTNPWRKPEQYFSLGQTKGRVPYDCRLVQGSAYASKLDLQDEQGEKVGLDANIRLFSGVLLEEVSDDAVFEIITENNKEGMLHKEESNLLQNKFSFVIFFLAFGASFYAQIVGNSVIIAFVAVLVCVCPCVILFSEQCLEQVGRSILSYKGIVYNGKSLLKDFFKIQNSALCSDYNGTLTEWHTGKLREGVSKNEDGILCIGETKISSVISSNDGIKHIYPESICLKNKSEFKFEGSIFYFGNNSNDMQLFKRKNVISCAVKNSPSCVKNSATFFSTRSENELQEFVSIPKLGKHIIRVRYLLFILAIIYCCSVVPLTIFGVIGPTFACLALCIASAVILGVSQLIKLLGWLLTAKHENIKITKEQAKKALSKMAYCQGNKLFSEYNKQQIEAQLLACGIKIGSKNTTWNFCALLFLGLNIGLTYIKAPMLQIFLHYTCVPFIMLCLFNVIYNGYKKILGFILGAATTLGAQLLAKIYNIKELNLLSFAFAGLALFVLFNNGLDMYEIQLSAIIILGVSDLAGFVRVHTHHLFIMGLILILASQIKTINEGNTFMQPLMPDMVPDYNKVKVEEAAQCININYTK